MTGMTARARLRAPGAAHALLGGLSEARFLRHIWQKEARLTRNAIAGFLGFLTAAQLFTLARRDDVESRIVIRDGARWSLVHGPFRRSDFTALPARNWTLLVQGVNLVSVEADALLRRFAFLPYARLDDLMVSYAAPGGGVGPHIDSYDVFLLQGFGRRRWRYGRQNDVTLRQGLPLRILKRFTPRNDEVLASGDMLYLPPEFAHDGVAIDACTTYSIGFRAPSAQELGGAFLDFLHDGLDLRGRYSDSDLAPVREPARIDSAMQRRYARMLDHVRWDVPMIERFVGCWLSEPKANVTFVPPRRPLGRAGFDARASKRGIRLDTKTQLLYDATHVYINGRALGWPAQGAPMIRRLANDRSLTPRAMQTVHPQAATILYTWYRDGYLHPDSA